jgi:hypothetical protein
MPREPSNQTLQYQDAQGSQDLRRSHSGADDQLVDGDRSILELALERSFLIGEGQLGGMADGGASGAVWTSSTSGQINCSLERGD